MSIFLEMKAATGDAYFTIVDAGRSGRRLYWSDFAEPIKGSWKARRAITILFWPTAGGSRATADGATNLDQQLGCQMNALLDA
jgi:hypothetical protein